MAELLENKVAERRNELGMTLERLHEASGVPVSTLGEIEKKGREPGVRTAQLIAWALGVSVDDLWPR